MPNIEGLLRAWAAWPGLPPLNPELVPPALSWLLLLALVLGLLLLPLLPAWREWRRPQDVTPLPIDAQDAQDPAFLARSFAQRLSQALAHGERRLGRSKLAEAPPRGRWPLSDDEWRRGRTQRVWHGQSDAVMPDDIHFLAEVAAPGALDTAPGNVYRALWAGHQLRLAAHATVLRWAHGQQVEVGAGCRLAGRVSADDRITVWGRSFFTLLHAPTICFGSQPDSPGLTLAALHRDQQPLSEPVRWDADAGRGVCDEPLALPDWTAWQGDLVCRDDLGLGMGCRANGHLKVHGALHIGEHSLIEGGVVAVGSVTLEAHCRVQGALVSEEAIVLGPGCVIGEPGRPATVAAPRIEVAPGVVVHGTLWASQRGQTQHDMPVREPADPLAVRAPLLPADSRPPRGARRPASVTQDSEPAHANSHDA